MRRLLPAFLLLAGCPDDNMIGFVNSPPEVTIVSPTGGETFQAGSLVEFVAVARDMEDPEEELTIFWNSVQDGELGTRPPDSNGNVYLATAELSGGNHTIILTAIDSAGASARDQVDLWIEGVVGAPTAEITGPADGSTFVEGDGVTFVGLATDGEQAWDTLACRLSSDQSGVFWAGSPGADGVATVEEAGLPVGPHTVTFSVEDADGHVTTDTVSIEILDNGSPSAVIQTPLDGTSHFNDEPLHLAGMVSDNETRAIDLAVTWESDLDGVLAAGRPDSSGATYAEPYLSPGWHVITLSVVDEDGLVGADTVRVELVDPLASDDDRDGWTEYEGDCDDDDASVSPGAAERCNDADDDCNGVLNDDWQDTYEPNETSAAAWDLGEVDGSLWSGSSVTLSALSLHHEGDEDWFRWDADDELWDNVNINVRVLSFPSRGTYTVELYLLDGGTWRVKDSASGSTAVSLSYTGDTWDDDEDDWAIRIYATSWPATSCAEAWQVTISS